MARGTQESNKTYFKIGYEGGDRDNGAPFFGEQKKVGDHYESVSADTFLEGKLTDIVKGTYKYTKGKQELTQHTFDLTITDGEDNYNLGVNCAYYTRSVLNSLSPITDFSNTIIRLEIYRNGDGFVNIAVKINGERSDWELKPSDLPKSDNEKWIASFEYFINKIKANLPEVAVAKPQTEESVLDGEIVLDTVKPEEITPDSGGLPF